MGFAAANFLEDMMISASFFTDGRSFYVKEQGEKPELLQDFYKRYGLTESLQAFRERHERNFSLDLDGDEITPDEFAIIANEFSLAMRKTYNVQPLSGVDAAILSRIFLSGGCEELCLARLLKTTPYPFHPEEAKARKALDDASFYSLFHSVDSIRKFFAKRSDPMGLFADEDKQTEKPALQAWYPVKKKTPEALKALFAEGVPIYAGRGDWPRSWDKPFYDSEKKRLFLPKPSFFEKTWGHAFNLIGYDASTNDVLSKILGDQSGEYQGQGRSGLH